MNVITVISALVVLVVCVFLVLHKDYEDGLIGRIALAAIALSALGRIAGVFEEGIKVEISPVGHLLWMGIAVFLGRHSYYFVRRRYGWGGIWRESNRQQTGGKQKIGA